MRLAVMTKSVLPGRTLLAFLFLFALILPSVEAQVPLFFDGFLADNAGMPANDFNAFFQWNVTDGTVDLVGGNVPGVDDPTMGGRFVDLAGSSNDPGIFTTRMPLVFAAGMLYNLSFVYSNTGGTMNQATATIGSQVFTVTATSANFVSFSQNFSFATTTMANLSFTDLGLGGDNFGVGIDTVQVSQVVPEPRFFSLLASAAVAGLVAWQARARRRPKARPPGRALC